MLRYYITQQASLSQIERQLSAGVEMIQLRERELSAKDLFALAERVMLLPNPHATRILINDRSDVALASGAEGVHLRGHSPAPSRIRKIAPPGFLIGVSCHSVDEVRRAADEGASFAVLAPIYPTAGKGPALGLGPLSEAARSVSIPVLALGGVTEQRVAECAGAGAAGIAGISMFQLGS